MTTLTTVELICMACGRDHELVVRTLEQLPNLPLECDVCGGSVLASGSTTRTIRTEAPYNWTADPNRPKVGRPPKSRQTALFGDGAI